MEKGRGMCTDSGTRETGDSWRELERVTHTFDGRNGSVIKW